MTGTKFPERLSMASPIPLGAPLIFRFLTVLPSQPPPFLHLLRMVTRAIAAEVKFLRLFQALS